MARADLLLLNASSLVTLRGPARARRGKEMRRLGIVKDGAIAVRDGRVLAVGTTRAIQSKYDAPDRLDVEGRVVVPGFVDAHTHLPFAGSRAFELELKLAGKSYLEILRAGGGIHRTVRDTRAATPKGLVDEMAPRLDAMLRWGTTTAEAKSGYGLDAPNELKQLRAIRAANAAQPVELVPTFLGAHVVPREYAKRRAAYVRLLTQDLLPRIAREGLAEFCDVFQERDAFTPKEADEILGEAARLGLRLKMHADEFTDQRGAEQAARLGCVSAEHLLCASKRGVRALAASDTIPVMLPGVSVLGFLDKFAPARSLIDAGAAVALGTDFNPNCNVLTMPTVIQWAVYHLRMHPAEALAAATVNAAYAIGRGATAGTIEAGKSADLVVLDNADLDNLVYRVGTNPVWWTAKKGRFFNAENAAKPGAMMG